MSFTVQMSRVSLLSVIPHQTDYGLSPPANFPEPHLIAQAFAAFYQNNKLRWSLGRPRLETETFLGIIFSRTAPSFYKITITKAVAQAMEGGISPEETTVVHKFTPRVRGEDGFLVHGMGHLESRRMVFRYLEAFKKFVCCRLGSHKLSPHAIIAGTQTSPLTSFVSRCGLATSDAHHRYIIRFFIASSYGILSPQFPQFYLLKAREKTLVFCTDGSLGSAPRPPSPKQSLHEQNIH